LSYLFQRRGDACPVRLLSLHSARCWTSLDAVANDQTAGDRVLGPRSHTITTVCAWATIANGRVCRARPMSEQRSAEQASALQ